MMVDHDDDRSIIMMIEMIDHDDDDDDRSFFLIQFNVPFKIISAHMRRANQ